MAFTASEKAHVVAKYIETGSITTTRRQIRTSMRIMPRTRNSIPSWHEQFLTVRNMAHRASNGRPRISDGEIEEGRSLFDYNLRLSIRHAESLPNMPRSTIQRILRKCLFCTCRRCKISTELTTQTREKTLPLHVICKTNMRVSLGTYQRQFFYDEQIFRLNGSVNTQNVRIWGTERPVEERQTFSHSPSIMLW